jgi:hypothetical protein
MVQLEELPCSVCEEEKLFHKLSTLCIYWTSTTYLELQQSCIAYPLYNLELHMDL